jgi:succinoglycan biosynthesis transport protein ExoP
MADGNDNQAGNAGRQAPPEARGPQATVGESTALVPAEGDGGICFVRFVPRPPFDERLVMWNDKDSARAASFRLLRQRLIDKGDPHALLCTSAGVGEGKTTLAANLALAFAELGRHRVLLVEANLRAAALGEVFGFKPPKGFAGQLQRHRTHPNDAWVVVQIGSSALYVMASEPRCCPHCASVIAEEARFCGMCGKSVPAGGGAVLDAVTFATAVRRFREAFDYIIVDAPAVLAGGDVNLIQDACEAIVFAARSGQSDAVQLRRALEQVAPAQVAAVALLEG